MLSWLTKTLLAQHMVEGSLSQEIIIMILN